MVMRSRLAVSVATTGPPPTVMTPVIAPAGAAESDTERTARML